MADPLLIARNAATECFLIPALANRHGLITGATGTGKTVTLQTLAENFSRIGVPVFMADIKGDLTGISQAGKIGDKLAAVLKDRGIELPASQACPATLWDVFGEQGHPVRATVSDMGPLLIGRMLNLNDTQAGVLNLVFKIADDNGLLLLDLKDLRAMLQHVGDNASQFTTEYGNVSSASVGAIQRGLLQIETQGGTKFFGEPMLNISDFMKRYAELFEQFGYKKENILMEYGYVRDIEQVNDYLGARKVFIDPENPPAGVVVQAKPSGDENQLEVQFIVNLD